MNKKAIVRFFESYVQRPEDFPNVSRLIGLVNAKGFAKLIDVISIESNPRMPKVSAVTKDIIDSLENKQSKFHLMTKGVLLSAFECKALDRGRFELVMEDQENDEIFGILDGGHNTLALGKHLLSLVAEESDVKKVKDWESFQDLWSRYSDEVANEAENCTFLVPVEVIYPTITSAECVESYIDSIIEITDARNNNSQLSEETKSNYAGYFDKLKASLDHELVDQVEWKANDGGRIKLPDLVALSLIPLSLLEDEKSLNPVIIYSSKAKCVLEFNRIFERGSQKGEGIKRELTDPAIESAISMMRDIPKLYDAVYELFPDAYNSAGGKFGRIDCVTIYDPARKGEKGVTVRQPVTKFYKRGVNYAYPDGFIVPLIFGMRALIENKDGVFSWKTDPVAFVKKHKEKILASYNLPIKMSGYDPQKVGKERASYEFAENAVKMALLS